MNIKTSVERIRGTSNYNYLVQILNDDNVLIAAASVVNKSLAEAAILAVDKLVLMVEDSRIQLEKAGLL